MLSLEVFISSSVYVTTLALLPFSLLCLVWLNFCAVFTGCFAFSLSRAKEVFYASPRTCSSAQSKEEPPAYFEKRVCLFLALVKVSMVLKTI